MIRYKPGYSKFLFLYNKNMKKTNHNHFIQLAISEAKKGIQSKHGGPYGCVIVKNNKVIAKSHNKVSLKNDVTSHGEMETIRLACKKLKTFNLMGCTLYTTAYPCPMCVAACKWAHIKKVYYGCTEADTQAIDSEDKKFYNAKLETTCVGRKECLQLFKQFKNKK